MEQVEQSGPDGRPSRYRFKLADSPAELRQLAGLNWRTFVTELGQYPDDGRGRREDKFHARNRYLIALHGERLVGMLAVHDQPPFSIEARLPGSARLRDLAPRPLEVRLLAVEPEHRGGPVFAGLGSALLRYARTRGYSHLLISGVASRQRMYEQIGFRALGPPVAEGRTAFVPMLVDMAALPAATEATAVRLTRRLRHGGAGDLFASEPAAVGAPELPGRDGPLLLTPGRAQPAASVMSAMLRARMDPRSPEFVELLTAVRSDLCQLARAEEVAVICGGGTLANDMLAGTLAADSRLRRGLVLANGEFGRRLVGHARRAGLQFETLEWTWGRPWDLGLVEERIAFEGRIDWIWGVALETSTGMVNDVGGLLRLVRPRGVRVCLDAVSALGSYALDLSEVSLASSVAHKALGGVAGLGLVFARSVACAGLHRARVPPALDLEAALRDRALRPTPAVEALLALHAALAEFRDEEERRLRFAHYLGLGRLVRARLSDAGLTPLVDGPRAAPAVTTFEAPDGAEAERLHARCRQAGFVLGGRAGYLRERGWLQIATFGDVRGADLVPLFECLAG